MTLEIIDALESTAGIRHAQGRIGDPTTSDHQDVRLWRKHLLQFLAELDEDLTVIEIREALEAWS